MFVMLDERLDSGGGRERQIRIRPGQNLKIGGAFREVPSLEVRDEQESGTLNRREYERMKGQNAYLHATAVSKVR